MVTMIVHDDHQAQPSGASLVEGESRGSFDAEMKLDTMYRRRSVERLMVENKSTHFCKLFSGVRCAGKFFY